MNADRWSIRYSLCRQGRRQSVTRRKKKMSRFSAWLLGGSIALTALASAGCQVPTSHTTMGWRFEVGRPATLSTPAAVSQGASNLALYPVGAVAAASPARPSILAAETPPACPDNCQPCPPSGGLLRRPALASIAPAAPPCDLNDVCNRLERLERRLGASSPPGAQIPAVPRSLPPGPPSEQQP